MSRRASDYRDPIVIQTMSADTQDDSGQPLEEWDDTYEEWARIERAYKGSEAFREGADVRVALSYYWVTIRYRSDITIDPATMRVKHGDRILEIINATDASGRKDELDLLCEERQA